MSQRIKSSEQYANIAGDIWRQMIECDSLQSSCCTLIENHSVCSCSDMSRIGRSSSGAGTYKSALCCKNFDLKILGTTQGDIVDSCADKMESRMPDNDGDSSDHDYRHNKSRDAAQSTDILSVGQRSLSANTTTKKNTKNTTQKSKNKSKRRNSLQTVPNQDPGTNYDNSTKKDISHSAPSSPQEASHRDKMNLIKEYHRNLNQRDKKSSKDPSFLDKHREINGEMRSILIDWLMEVCDTYSLHQDTFHLAIDITDRFMATTSYTIFRDQYQLLGITSLFVASKLEEIYPPTIHDFVYVTDSLYSPDDLKKQEKLIVESLKFDLLSSTIISKYVKFYVQNFNWAQSDCSIVDRGNDDDGNRENMPKQTTWSSNKTNAKHLVHNSKLGSDCSHTYSINTIEDITALEESSQMLYPVHNEDIYRETMLLINLMILDVNCVKFRPSILALSAVIYTSLLFEAIPDGSRSTKFDNSASNRSAAFQYKRFDKKHHETLNSIKPPDNTENLVSLLLPDEDMNEGDNLREIKQCLSFIRPFIQTRMSIFINSLGETRFNPHLLDTCASKASAKTIGPFLPHLLQTHHNELKDLDQVAKWRTLGSRSGARDKEKERVLGEIN